MKVIHPLPRRMARALGVLVVIAWVATMGVLINRSYLQASAGLAADLARYGSEAQWHGVYYRGDKIGFTVRQTVPVGRGFELQEEGRLQMTLLGATSWTEMRTTVRVDEQYVLEHFEFSLDPGTGATKISGTVRGSRLVLEIVTPAGRRTEERELAEPPILTVGIGRRLAAAGLAPGAVHRWRVLDPATLRTLPLTARVGERRLVDNGFRRRPVPAFEVSMEFAGLRATSWVTDTGEIIREESPFGLITVRETAETARAMAVPLRGRTDLLEAAAVVPAGRERVAEPRDVQRVTLRISGADLSGFETAGLNQSIDGDLVTIVDPRTLRLSVADPSAAAYLAPEPLIESDDEAIVAEARRAVEGVTGTRERAERLVRHVNALLEKKPTVSLPSAREVLRTRVGDCNEHTALYVAMARAIGIPARIAVGLAFTRGAFYYHAWPEVYVDEGSAVGGWLPVDPTFNQFPADAMHLRLARGGLAEQARILPLIGALEIAIVDVYLDPQVSQVIVGSRPDAALPPGLALPQRSSTSCWDTPPAAPAPERRR